MARPSPCTNVWAPKPLSYTTAVISGILGCISTFGNLLVVIAVVKDPFKKLRTPFMYFLVNLAFSDLIVGCVTMPTSIITHTMEAQGTKKKVHARIIQLSYFMSTTASILSLAVLCVDRYLAVKKPLMHKRVLNFKVCVVVSLFIWAVSISLPFLFFVVGYMNYLMIFAHTGIIITIFIMFFTYWHIIALLKKQNQKMQGNLSVYQVDERKKTQARFTKVFILILGFVVICYTPAIIFIYILKFCSECNCDFRHVLRDLQFLFIVANSCINPFVCTIQLKPFKNALKAIVRFRSSSYFVESETSRTREQRTVATTEIKGADNGSLE